MTKQNHTKGIILSFAGYTVWVVGDAFVKLAGESIPIVEILFISFLVGSIFTIFVACKQGGLKQLSTTRPWFHLLRSLLIMAATYGSVAGVIYLSLADFYTIVFTSPLLVTVLGGLFLKEKIDPCIWLSTIFGFIGVVVAVQFANTTSAPLSWMGIGVTLLSSFAHSIVMLTTRDSTNENNYSLSFWPQVVSTFISLFILLILGTFVYDIRGIVYSVLCGIAGAIGVLLTNASLQVAPVSVVSPYHYTQIVGGAIIGYLVWNHVPDWSVVIGAIMVVASGLYILRVEQGRKVLMQL